MPMIYGLKEYTSLLTEGYRRLILICPVGHTLPPEITEDIVILDFEPPSYAEQMSALEVIPSTSMANVGGLDNLKDWVRKRSRCFSQEARNFGVEAPKGCGLFGLPGRGNSGRAERACKCLPGLQPVAGAFRGIGFLRQATVRNADEFREQLRILDAAAVGVVLCRTREPHRAAEAIKSFAFSRVNRDFANWTPLYGWETYNKADPTAAPRTDNVKEPVAALSKIGGLDGSEGFANGFYTYMFPHFWLRDGVGQRVPMIYALREYTRQFAESKRRLILITPLGFTLPSEVAEDVVVLDFDAPSHAEIMASLEQFLSTLDKRPRLSKEDKDRLVAAGMGMSQQEFETAISRAIVTYAAQLPNVPVDELVDEVMKVKTEVVKRSEVLEVMPATSMSNVGGLDNLKDWVRKRSHCFSQEARNFGVEAPKGCGLFGPPGTGRGLLSFQPISWPARR